MIPELDLIWKRIHAIEARLDIKPEPRRWWIVVGAGAPRAFESLDDAEKWRGDCPNTIIETEVIQ